MRKFLALAALLPALTLAADDWQGGVGLTNEAGQHRVTLDSAKRWTCALNALAASLTECKALTAGRTYFITDIVVQTTTTTSGQFAIQSGTGTNCGSNTAAVFPSSDAAHRYNAPITSSPLAHISFITPLAVTVSHAVCVIGTATNTISITLSGFYTP
jgi:hypothetical protein